MTNGWWLRSPNNNNDNNAGYVNGDNGNINNNNVNNDDVGVSPAFNVNLSSVIFSSVINPESTETYGKEYKLTLKDNNTTITPGTLTRSGNTVTVPYTIADSAANDGITADTVSVLIKGADGAVKYYAPLTGHFAANGSGTFDLPADYTYADTVYVLAEDTHEGDTDKYLTDYASEMVSITIPAAFTNASVTLCDDLALNFYVDGVTAETADAYTVNFTGACVDEYSALTYNAAVSKYYATTHVYAKDIDKDITATLCKGSEVLDTIENYSITQYLSSSAFSEADDKTTALITATQNFGYASAEYFYDDNYGVTATFEDYNPDVSAYAPTFGSDAAKLSLVLDSKTAARLYIKGDDTGTESTISSTKADYPTYHEVAGLLPQNLADEQTITVGGVEYKFSALSWCDRVLNNTSASTKNVNMAKAIMAYYTAAKNYSSVDVSSVTLDQSALTLTAGGDTATLTATVLPEYVIDKTVTWSSDNEAVATVVDGVVTPVAKGTATITATAGGKSDTCTVTVKQLYSITFTGPYSNATLVMEYYEGDTWNDMATKYPTYIMIDFGYAAFSKDGFN